MTTLEQMGAKAKDASRFLMTAGSKKDIALGAIADALCENCEEILAANKIDLENGEKSGLTASLLDRLRLSEERINGMADGVRQVAALPDPVGRVLDGRTLKNGLQIEKVTVPMGVIGIIFEARPNVTSDAAALCLKAGSAVILRGGKEAFHSNMAIARVMRDALEKAGFPRDCVALVEDTTRQSATELMQLSDYLDVLIPRGGAGLIKSVVENAKVPVIETGVGNCHIYVDKSADIEMAKNIVFNGKTSRPSVCNALETLLVHKDIAEKALPVIKAELDKKNVEIRGCDRTKQILGNCVVTATEEDYRIEFLDYIIAVKVVDSLDDAIAHIQKYSTGHSECIVTSDYNSANEFTARIDSAAVYVNASTRFTDGGEFGLGAEIGISTRSSTQEDLWDLTSLQAQNISSEETDKSDNHIRRYISASKTDGSVFSSISSITSKRIRLCSLFLNIRFKRPSSFFTTGGSGISDFGSSCFSGCFGTSLLGASRLNCGFRCICCARLKASSSKLGKKSSPVRTIRFHAVTA